MSATPTYAVRESPRARNVRRKMSARDGLVVVVPKGFDRDRIPGLLRAKKHWLDRATEKVEQQRKFFEPEPPGRVPARITLRAIGEEWSVYYRPTDDRRVAAVERSDRRLLVYGDTDNGAACKGALKRWLGRKTHEHLAPWLKRTAAEKCFAAHKVIVRSQRTRWASCSRRKTISLNLKLLFLPPELIRYVFLHELCHSVRLDHSAHFWALLREHEPDCRKLDERLRASWRFVPAWIDRHHVLE